MTEIEPRVPEALLDAGEVAQWLGVKVDWVYDEAEAGRLPCVPLGRRTLRFDPEDIRAHMDRLRRGGIAAEPLGP